MSKVEQDVLVIIPTMCDYDLIVECVARIIESTAIPMKLLLVLNPDEEMKHNVDNVVGQTKVLVEQFNELGSHNTIDFCFYDAPLGWTGAVNAGVKIAMKGGLPETIVVMNDDIIVTPGWLTTLRNALSAERIWMNGELATHGESYFESEGHPVKGYGRIGIAGPVSSNVAGAQCVRPPSAKLPPNVVFEYDSRSALNQFARNYCKENEGRVLSTDFLSGFCMAYKRECLLDLLLDGDDLMDPVYKVGGFDDNDVCVRAEQKGWRRAIAVDSYVYHMGHRSLDRIAPEQQRGLANAPVYLGKWLPTTKRSQRLVACYRLKMGVAWDVKMLSWSLDKVTELVDGVAIVLTGSPTDVLEDPELPSTQMDQMDLVLISDTNLEPAEALKSWLEKRFGGKVDFAVEFRDPTKHEWNERDERNHSIELAESLSPDWIMSVDHDEVPEDRLTRKYFDRLMSHPNPEVCIYDFGWLNHWDTARVVRVDPPWASSYNSSMRGFRMWRHNPASPRRITGGTERGLHCGNSPDFSDSAKRISSVRMRHFGYMRINDRVRKYNRYQQVLDPNPDMLLTGGGYNHLVREENMQLSPYMPQNGIMFTMLMHSGESATDLFRILDTLYSLCDQIVLVWTDDCEIPGPIAEVAMAYGAEWVFSQMPEEGSLAECRNAALDKGQESVRWVLTLDPDEHFANSFHDVVALRRMAEATDSFGWMFQFKNHRRDGTFNMSETVRMFVLDRGGLIRYSGRVHEKLEKAFEELRKRGVHPQVRYAPFTIEHFGLAKSDEEMQAKLDKYTKLLAKAIEEEPLNCGHWTALGLQYGNDGFEAEQAACFAIARECAGGAYLPHKCSAQLMLRQARRAYEHVLHTLANSHPFRAEAEKIYEWLSHHAPEMPLSGNARLGKPKKPDVDIDKLVGIYDQARKVVD